MNKIRLSGSHTEVFWKKLALKNLTKFTGKHLGTRVLFRTPASVTCKSCSVAYVIIVLLTLLIFRVHSFCFLFLFTFLRKWCILGKRNVTLVKRLFYQRFESRWMSVELICYVKTIIIVFYKFYGFFGRQHSLMNRPCYNNLFQFMQLDNFRNLNRVILTYWKHLDSRVMPFDTIFQ